MPKKLLIVAATFVLLALGAAFFVWYEISSPVQKGSAKEVIFQIRKGERGAQIASNLEEQGLIRSSFSFRFYTITRLISQKLQAGTYGLSPSMTIPEIAHTFAAGDVVRDQITIIEGWTVRDIARHLEELDKFPADEVVQELGELEGYLFPDTYEIRGDMTVRELGAKIWQNFEEKFSRELREEILAQGKTIHDIVTMASLLEREVRTAEDKKVIAGILWKRLENDMPLQVDAAVAYAMGYEIARTSGLDLQIDSPYNTYANRGLPPGPISNPGMESILAAIYPEESPYWYYLSASDGKTVFSRNFEEHKAAKARYLQ